MSDDRFRVCDGCALEWRGDAPCWACGRAGVVQQRSHFAGATWRVEEYDRYMAETARTATRGNA